MRRRCIYTGKEMKPCSKDHCFSIKHFRYTNSVNRMVREYVEKSGGGGGGVALSVVPLLQERFRRLQRMKELREGKELLRMLAESERSSPPTTKLMSESYFSGSEVMFLNPPKPQCQLSLSLCPVSSAAAAKTLFSDAPLVCSLPVKLDVNSAADIDTSLRL